MRRDRVSIEYRRGMKDALHIRSFISAMRRFPPSFWGATDLCPVLDSTILVDDDRHPLAVESVATRLLTPGDPVFVSTGDVTVVGLEAATVLRPKLQPGVAQRSARL